MVDPNTLSDLKEFLWWSILCVGIAYVLHEILDRRAPRRVKGWRLK